MSTKNSKVFATHEMKEEVHKIFLDSKKVIIEIKEHMCNLPYFTNMPEGHEKSCEEISNLFISFVFVMSHIYTNLIANMLNVDEEIPKEGTIKIVQEFSHLYEKISDNFRRRSNELFETWCKEILSKTQNN